jgi:hypothetical protein
MRLLADASQILRNRPRSYVRKEKSQILSAASLGALKAMGKGRKLTQFLTHTDW